MTRGDSFLNASPMAGTTILLSVSVVADARLRVCEISMTDMGVPFKAQ